MGIQIDSVSVNGLGPISSIQWGFKDINLIYGKNEQGKTFLVEYILASLFKNAPKTRHLTDSGQVIVSGIDGSAQIFNPKTKKKIEDHLLSPGNASIDLARLCVVKGGELSMTSVPGGTVTKSILKEYLSDQTTLDKILERIPTVVQKSSWENEVIIPSRKVGWIKSLEKAKKNLEKINEMLLEIDQKYSQGQVKKATIELESVKEKVKQQERAKRAYAYQLSTQITALQEELDTIPEEWIEKAAASVIKVDNLQIRLQRFIEEVEELEPKVENYPWLKAAVEECERRPEALEKEGTNLFVILAVLSVVFTIAASFFNPYISLGTGSLSLLFVFLAMRQFQANMKDKGDRQEVKRMYTEFESRFEIKVKSIATLKSNLETLQEDFHTVNNKKQEITTLKLELSQAQAEMTRDLGLLKQENLDEYSALDLIDHAKERRNRLLKHLQQSQVNLAAANVPPEEYLNETIETEFSASTLKQLEEDLRSLEETISNENKNLDLLKQKACAQTEDDMVISWEVLIENLRTMQEQALEECISLNAQITGGIFVTEVIADLRKQEDEHIYNALASKNMVDPIKAITPAYTGVELEDKELIVFNDMQRFPLSDMSTGAKEQVLLALRIGLAAYVLGSQKMFLILDDAFQHSDWTRRERLIDEMVVLAEKGWQIIYFSMDDHIKSLFEKRVKPKMKERCQIFELIK
ncbi:MAG: hypothetical protein K8R77_07815 [Anaerolineaceae bacterium]|nr:hypothetical protein [Anaerolineaceae bacterium]